MTRKRSFYCDVIEMFSQKRVRDSRNILQDFSIDFSHQKARHIDWGGGEMFIIVANIILPHNFWGNSVGNVFKNTNRIVCLIPQFGFDDKTEEMFRKKIRPWSFFLYLKHQILGNFNLFFWGFGEAFCVCWTHIYEIVSRNWVEFDELWGVGQEKLLGKLGK